MLRIFVFGVALALLACTPPYGRQACTTSSECSTGQHCPALCVRPDAGVDDGGTTANVQAVCKLACTTDADCGNLGLKKPACAIYSCTGEKVCIDNPF